MPYRNGYILRASIGSARCHTVALPTTIARTVSPATAAAETTCTAMSHADNSSPSALQQMPRFIERHIATTFDCDRGDSSGEIMGPS
jgi:hypothetical protein